MSSTKPTMLHLGDPIKYNPDLYQTFSNTFTILRPLASERTREEFKTALRENRYGPFAGILRPFWNTGGEMGNWDKELIDLLPKSVRIFASAGAGFDWVDTRYLAEKGILYCNGAAASSESVADMTLFLILASFRNLAWSHNAAISQNPRRFLDAHTNSPLTARNPRGHTLGIIGLGQIGYTIAKKVHAALGMKILYHDIIRKSEEVEKSVDGTFYKSLDDMLSASDCVVVATPFAGKTLLTAELFGKFKRGSRFVNIARGSLVDEEALLGAIEDGTLVGVGMDVHADEPNVHPRLASHPKVMMMSHNAGGTVDTHIGFERLAMENVLAYFTEGRALTPVNAHLVKSKSVL